MKVGELREFRNGRNPITKEIIYILGLIVDIHEDPDPIFDSCKVLTQGGTIKWLNPHGSKEIVNETWRPM